MQQLGLQDFLDSIPDELLALRPLAAASFAVIAGFVRAKLAVSSGYAFVLQVLQQRVGWNILLQCTQSHMAHGMADDLVERTAELVAGDWLRRIGECL